MYHFCPECKHRLDRDGYFRAYVCTNPKCGYRHPIEERDIEKTVGELLEVASNIVLIMNGCHDQNEINLATVVRKLTTMVQQWNSEWQ